MISDISFHNAVYSQGSNTEKHQAGASKEGTRESPPPWAFIPPQSPCAQVSPFLLRPQLLFPVFIHLAAVTHIHLLLFSKMSGIRLLPCFSVSIPLAGVTHLSCPLLSQRLAAHCLLSQVPNQSLICMSTHISLCILRPLDQIYYSPLSNVFPKLVPA